MITIPSSDSAVLSETRRGSSLLRGLAALILLGSAVAGPAAAPGVKATLNGAELEFDGDTGALLRLAYPGVGSLLQATPARVSLIDLAYPHPKFESMTDNAAFAAEYKSGGLFSTLGLRWLDYGSLKGGLSLYARQWGWDEPITVRLQLSEVEQKLRLVVRHDMVLVLG